jgi:hypothetical protein
MTFCAFFGSDQRLGSSAFAFSEARRSSAVSQSKRPPQESERLLDVVRQFLRFCAHGRPPPPATGRQIGMSKKSGGDV